MCGNWREEQGGPSYVIIPCRASSEFKSDMPNGLFAITSDFRLKLIVNKVCYFFL